METGGRLPVSDLFYSLQGEGRWAGTPAVFVRLFFCNMGCAFCDSSFAWDKSLVGEVSYYAPDELATLASETIPLSVQAFSDIHVVITGGEPLLFQELIPALVVNLKRKGLGSIQVETNGTITPAREALEMIDWWNCSPKLSNCGIPEEIRFKREVLRTFVTSNRADFKFVVRDQSDVEEVSRCYGELIPPSRTWLMPEGNSRSTQLNRMADIAELASQSGYRFSPRLHVLMWDDQRGK